jgi:hypothetical protein
METWNRDELYSEVWEQPLVKAARKYGISAVMLGKVCRKLQIPLPGRGYWIKKEFGKPVEQAPLPEAKDLSLVQRFKDSPKVGNSPEQQAPPKPEPTDDLYRSIVEMESRTITVDPNAKIHKLVQVAAKTLSRSQPDSRGILETKWNEPHCLDIRVTKSSLDRAVTLINAIVMALEKEEFPVSVQEAGKHSTSVLIFGHSVPFAITEKVREIGRRQVKEYSWTKTIIDYEGRGSLEFRSGDYAYGQKIRDSKKNRLETLIPQCIGALMREARSRVHRAEEAKREEIERQKKARERAKLAEQIAEEEKKVSELESWVADWARAKQMREFIAELETAWKGENLDLSPDAPKGKRIIWMKQQADRIDPMLPSPPSILDRKREVNYW